MLLSWISTGRLAARLGLCVAFYITVCAPRFEIFQTALQHKGRFLFLHKMIPFPERGIMFTLASQKMPWDVVGSLSRPRIPRKKGRVTNSRILLVLCFKSHKMLHVAPKMCWKRRPFLDTRILSECSTFTAAMLGSLVEWYKRESLKVFVGLDAKDDIFVGTASRLLAQEQPWSQARRLARDGHVVGSPRLAVFVHHSETPAGGAVPDALPRPEGVS